MHFSLVVYVVLLYQSNQKPFFEDLCLAFGKSPLFAEISFDREMQLTIYLPESFGPPSCMTSCLAYRQHRVSQYLVLAEQDLLSSNLPRISRRLLHCLYLLFAREPDGWLTVCPTSEVPWVRLVFILTLEFRTDSLIHHFIGPHLHLGHLLTANSFWSFV